MIKTKKLKIDIFPVLQPQHASTQNRTLRYSSKNQRLQTQNLALYTQMWKEFLRSPIASKDEAYFSRQLELIHYGQQAVNLMSGRDPARTQKERAKWMTNLSVTLYGTQDVHTTREILANDLFEFAVALRLGKLTKHDVELLKVCYESLGVREPKKSKYLCLLTEHDLKMRHAFEPLYEKYIPYVEFNKLYSAREQLACVVQILHAFALEDSRFKEWKIVQGEGSGMRVDSQRKYLIYGKNRPTALGVEFFASLMHEMLAHMYRAENDVNDAYSYPDGYAEFEEGLGCYIEMLICGRIPDKLLNRLIAASLALGQCTEKALDRNEIFTILSLRTEMILKSRGIADRQVIQAKIAELRPLVIDRFFRGGRGIGNAMPICTKDTMYARGFQECRAYILQCLQAQHEPASVVKHLLSGKFNPAQNR